MAQSSGVAAESSAATRQDVPDVQQLRRVLDDILAEPEFRRAMRSRTYDSRELNRWLLLRLQRLIERLGGLHETNYGLFLMSVVVGSVLLLLLLGHIALTIARALGGPMPGAQRPSAPRPSRAKSPEEYVREADELAAQGAFREAVRALYLGLIRLLQLQGFLPRTSTQTNREQLQHLREHTSLFPVMERFVETFETKWYGQRPASPRDVEQCRVWFAAVRQEVEAR